MAYVKDMGMRSNLPPPRSMDGPAEVLGYQRTPRNAAEMQFFMEARKNGLEVCKRGWPDFFTVGPDGEIALVEVKPTPEHPLKHEQEVVMKALAKYGVPCFRWSPAGGFERIR